MSSNESPSLYLIPHDCDAIAMTAKLAIERALPMLPDLSHITILLPDLQAAPRLRQQLLKFAKEHNVHALIGPNIGNFQEWLVTQSTPYPQLTPQQRELMLTEVLMEHPHLYGKGSPWMLADSLLELFDELTLHQVNPPPDYSDFVQMLSSAYRTDAKVERHLGREASLVHTLWQAWHQQLAAGEVMDPTTNHLLALAEKPEDKIPDAYLFLVGFHYFTEAELDWLRRLLERQRASLLLQGSSSDTAILRLLDQLEQGTHLLTTPREESPLTAFLDAVYNRKDMPLRDRARQFAASYPDSPARGHLYLFEARNSDEEAQAIDIQVRRWLLTGHRRIGIVTENRKLARQVRALLEQGGVALVDSAGWALSTTRAAASLERWLQAVEEEFDHRPLLDLLKSSFVFADMAQEPFDNVVHRFEQDIVHNGNIARGLARYRQHLEYRGRHLPQWTREYGPAIQNMLERLEKAAAPLLPCLQGKHLPRKFIDALLQSIETLGMQAALSEDEAGNHVLEQLGQLADAAKDSRLKMDWQAFRTWLGTNLERAHFRPRITGSPVQLMNLSQSALGKFDALIIASAEREFLPGTRAASPFFNDTVRAELGLPTQQEQLAQRFHLFRRLLQAAPRLLFTLRCEQDGETITATPWLESLRAFHRLGYGSDLEDNDLSLLVGRPGTAPFRCDTGELPEMTRMPKPCASSSLIPSIASASAYQQLVDCPYRFFIAYCLKLAAPERVREALAKSDFGERIHRCLEAFHTDLPDLPGPFHPPFEESRRDEAIRLLEEIAEQVFADDLEDNFLHRGWLQQCMDLIPGYIEWQLQRAAAFRVQQTELEFTREMTEFSPSVRLRGRIDRLDDGEKGMAVVDYKTGNIPTREEILKGESVQLPFYALLMENQIVRAEYLQLTSQGVDSRVILEGEELASLTEQIGQRLSSLWQAIGRGSPLPAWGDEFACNRCSFAGICRRQTWDKVEQQGVRN